MERQKYITSKSLGNNSEYLYLIDASWVEAWISFLRYGSAPPPSLINNDHLYLMLVKNDDLLLGV
jgi:hypothetical protein